MHTPSLMSLGNQIASPTSLEQKPLLVVRTKHFPSFLSQAHQLDYSAHYLRLKFLMENKMLFYTPQPEEDIYELVMFTIAVPVCSV